MYYSNLLNIHNPPDDVISIIEDPIIMHGYHFPNWKPLSLIPLVYFIRTCRSTPTGLLVWGGSSLP